MGAESKDKIMLQCIEGVKSEQGSTTGTGCIPIIFSVKLGADTSGA